MQHSRRRVCAAAAAAAGTAAAEDGAGDAAEPKHAPAEDVTSSDTTDLSVDEPAGFLELGIDPLLVAGLAESGIEVPSPIQESAIPVLLSGQNAAVQSYTGSGKVRLLSGS
jgi:ATP-dependent RNA helicase DeaD